MRVIQGIQAVTFDFFNTLVSHRRGDGGRGSALMEYLRSQGLESDPWEHQVLYDVLEPHAREYAPDQSPAVKHNYLCRLAERVFERLNVRSEVQEARSHATKIWELIGPSSLAVFPEVPRTLERLRAAGYRLAVVSNWQCGLRHFCVELGIEDMFEHVVASAEVGYAKPRREIFEEACRRLAVPADRVLHVGDTVEDDVEGARGAGMRAVLVSRQGESGEPTAIRGLEGVLQVLGLNQGEQIGGSDRDRQGNRGGSLRLTD
jgi:HAD superfamily hydrolase (TIGR01549 family)